jgi:hypothetical protein
LYIGRRLREGWAPSYYSLNDLMTIPDAGSGDEEEEGEENEDEDEDEDEE